MSYLSWKGKRKMIKKFPSKGQYRFSFIASLILLIFSVICTIPAPFFIVLDIIFGFMAYSFGCVWKHYDIEKRRFDYIQKHVVNQNASAISAAIVKCPRCGCANIKLEEKNFSLARAAAGNIIAGPIGGVLGFGVH